MNFILNLIKSKKSDEDSARKEFILNVMLVSSLILSFAAALFILYCIFFVPSRSGVSFTTILVLFLVLFFLLVLSKRGFSKASAIIFVLMLFTPTTTSFLRWGMDMPQGLITYALLIVISSILISTRFSFLIVIIESIAALVISYIHNSGILIPDMAWKKNLLATGDIIIIIVSFGVIAVVSWLSNREIERSLRRAWRSEKALKKERDMLEKTVENRTKELKRVQLEKMSQMAKFADFGQLASGIFHDLQNPLTAIQLNLESLRANSIDRLKDSGPFLEEAIIATKRAERFASAVNMQLKQQEVIKNFNPYDELLQIMDVLGYKSKRLGIQVKLSGSEGLSIKGNPMKFHQITTNLLSNALDAYSGINKPEMKVLINISREINTVVITVKDYGKGISNSLQSKIFDPFFTTKEIEAGTGIGLAIAKKITEQDFKGEISLESKEGTGSTFTLKLADEH